MFFTAENMYFYGLDTANGNNLWTAKKLTGQNTAFTVPVLYQNNVMLFTTSSLYGAEETSTGLEEVFETLRPNGSSSPAPSLSSEMTAIRNYFNGNPSASTNNVRQKLFHVFRTSDGNFPFAKAVPMGRVTGNNFAAYPPVISNYGPLMYWRSSFATLLNDGSTFGTQYCPDISAMDNANGNRVPVYSANNNGFYPELDNGFFLTMGGNRLYFQNSFRGTISMNMTQQSATPPTVNGSIQRMTASLASQDGGNFQGWGYQIIYYGNDSTGDDIRPTISQFAPGWQSGVVPAEVNGTKLLFINEIGSGAAGNTLRMNAGLVALQGS